jgi:hypothetical protein
MGGLILFGVLFVWTSVSARLARSLSRAIDIKPSLRAFASIALAILIFLLPVADELAARPYFEALCHKGAVLRIDEQKIRGKDVMLTIDPSNERVKWAIIPMFHSHFEYRDAVTTEVLAEYETYAAHGGVLARIIAFNGSHPWTGTFYCAPEVGADLRKRYGFVVLN